METTRVEQIAVSQLLDQEGTRDVKELNELQLSLIGGGSADPLFS